MARILIAEHNAATTRYLTNTLKKSGNSVDIVDNCLDAWRAFSKDTYDVLLVDIIMPGIDGFVLAQKALQDNPGIQVVFITGFAGMAMDTYATPPYAPVPIMTQPFHLREIAARIRYLMGHGHLPQKGPSTDGSVVYADFSRKEAVHQNISV